MLWLKLAVFLLMFALPLLAQPLEGYPEQGVSIISKEFASIKNDFCFPVVVSVNGATYEVEPNKEISLNTNKWSSWNWLPGKQSKVTEKTVKHPLSSGQIPSFGPGIPPTHIGADKYGYDFSVPEGTVIKAMVSGVIVRVIDKYTEAHTDEKRKGEGNIIQILHDDGTMARYSHLKEKSSKVKLCEKIRAGDPIALSGNTGFSPVPHLHVDILRPVDGKKYATIPLKLD